MNTPYNKYRAYDTTSFDSVIDDFKLKIELELQKELDDIKPYVETRESKKKVEPELSDVEFDTLMDKLL